MGRVLRKLKDARKFVMAGPVKLDRTERTPLSFQACVRCAKAASNAMDERSHVIGRAAA